MDVELLKTVARQRLVAIQDEFDFGDGRRVQIALPITSSSAKRLWNALVEVYDELGFATASTDDEVFRSLVLLGRMGFGIFGIFRFSVGTVLGVLGCACSGMNGRACGVFFRLRDGCWSSARSGGAGPSGLDGLIVAGVRSGPC